MLDPKLVRSHKHIVEQAYQKRGFNIEKLEDFIQLDITWREDLKELEALKQQRNQLVPKGKPSDLERERLKDLSLRIKHLQESLKKTEETHETLSLSLPNILLEDVPAGLSEEDNREIKIVGQVPSFSFTPKSHDVLGLAKDLFDFEAGSRLAGSRFTVLKGKGARLERALINFMLNVHTKDHGYEEFFLPSIVNSKSLTATGQLPKFASDLFRLEGSDFWLSPTAEVQLTNLFRNQILSEADLPLKCTSFTTCFRSEAGSYGKDVKGYIRQHQFSKVELVQFVSPEDSKQSLNELLGHAEKICQLLNLPYRVVELCGGDVGFSSAKTYDIEVWFPSQNCYREISSCSNFLDFQSRRGMIRYKSDSGINYVHTINGSGLAVGRCLAAILENYQDEHGNIKIPELLINLCGFEMI